jgi:type III restriction enzyme
MKEKEKLLSLDNKLRFIFSHSALKEGWDNLNVFQICTLNETESNDKKRQEIGRGMRLCVNNNGERETDKKINRLTVMANESYDAFVSALQSDMEEELGIKFGIIEEKMFKDIVFVPENITDEKRVKKYKEDGSRDIFNDLKLNNYITQQGYPTEKLKDAVENDYLEVNEKFENIKEDIIYKIENRISMPNIVNNSGDRKEVKINNDNFDKFINLWNIIKQKTNYAIDFNSDELISNCSESLSNIKVSNPVIYLQKHIIDLKESGIEGEELESLKRIKIENKVFKVPNIIEFLQKETFLTRKTISRILLKSNSLDEFKKNPQQYMDLSLKIISDELNNLILNKIKYNKIEDIYSQEIFDPKELYVYIKNEDYDNALVVKSKRSIYNLVKCESKNEVNFAKKLEIDSEVVTYAKLPNKFKIDTPIGSYNPDWAILTEKEGMKTIYFVIETKGNIDVLDLRVREKGKIDCGKKHFTALGNKVVFEEVDGYEAFKKLMDQFIIEK